MQAFAQHWQDIATFQVHDASLYFLNEKYGFVFTTGSNCPNCSIITDPIVIWRTTDGGNTWDTIIPPISNPAEIWQLLLLHQAMDIWPWTAVRERFVGDYGQWLSLAAGKNAKSEFRVSRWLHFNLLFRFDLFAISSHNSISGVALWKSSNEGWTWRKDSAVMHPEYITGNRENLLEASGPGGGWYGVNNFDSNIFTSTYNGNAWSVTEVVKNGINLFCLIPT